MASTTINILGQIKNVDLLLGVHLKSVYY
ncbi:hypothetical protein BCEP27_160012 [Burkholderia cepacia]